MKYYIFLFLLISINLYSQERVIKKKGKNYKAVLVRTKKIKYTGKENFTKLIKDAWNNDRKKLEGLYWAWGDALYKRGEKRKALKAWLSILDVKIPKWDTYKKLSNHVYLKGYKEEAFEVLSTSLDTNLDSKEYMEGADFCIKLKNNFLAEQFLNGIMDRHWIDEKKIIPVTSKKLIKIYEVKKEKLLKEKKTEEAKNLSLKIESLKKGIRPMDVKIILTWDTKTDVDLWVTNPKLKRCFYSRKLTVSGEKLHNDDTDGFGPETFTILKAQEGRYKIQVNFFNGKKETKTKIKIIFNVGQKNQYEKNYEATLKKLKETKDVVDIYIPNDLKKGK